jgi:beta-galactosidase
VVVEFPQPVRIAGIRCLPTQDSYDGAIREFSVMVSEDLKTWHEAANGAFELSLEQRRVRFAQPETIRAFKLVALSGYGDRPLASLAELSIIAVK